MWSHYNYWKNHKGDVGHRISPIYTSSFTFEEFAFLPELENYQTQAIGKNLSIYEYIGVTDRLDEFAIRSGLISKNEKVPIVNKFSKKLPVLSKQFIEEFKKRHEEDYAIYEWAILSKNQ
jgi:hypothetical protein